MNLKDIFTCLVALTVLTTAIYAAEKHYAKHTHLCMLEMRIDQKWLWDRKKDIENRLWGLESEYGVADGMPQAVRLEYWKLRDELKEVEYELERLKGGN